MQFLKKNPVLYASLQQILDRGTAEILESGQQGIFLKDTISGACMLAAEDCQIAIQWLKAHENITYDMLVLFEEELVSFGKERYGFQETMDCFQAVYTKKEPPATGGTIQIRTAGEEDLTMIAEHYKLLGEQELLHNIRRGELFIGMQGENAIGFVGQHLEGSMGMLEVFPEYRKAGFGTELESYMIEHMLEEGLIPFCQVEAGNEKSMGLQRKLGLRISQEHLYWLY